MFCRTVGVQAVGFTLELPTGLHDGLTKEKAREIIQGLPHDILPVLITYLRKAEEAGRLAAYIVAGAVQFHAGLPEEQIRRFREICPDVKSIACVTVRGETAMAETAEIQPPLWDAILLDSFDPATGKRGATGIMHDWTISARIVEASSLPIILAGGLNPDNVADAIRTVRPHGVDAHTGLENRDGTRNFAKIRAFARTALEAFQGLENQKGG